jgi:hypothetical protein
MTYGTTIVLEGTIIRQSQNLRGMRDYARTSRVYRVHAKPDPENTYRGILSVEYENGATSEASFACFTVLLEWLRDRRSWRTAPFWTIEKPAPEWVSWRTWEAWEGLHAKGLTVSASLPVTYGPEVAP